MASAVLKALVNHVFLPPQIPGKDDASLPGLSEAFFNALIKAVLTLRDSGDEKLYRMYDSVRLVLQTARVLNANGKLDRDSLTRSFRELDDRSFLILHVVEQNAGLLIKEQKEKEGKSIIFEAFEVSARSADVLAAQGALVQTFPSSASQISAARFVDPCFQAELATFLEQASTESIKKFAAATAKAGSGTYESRDTVDPAVITELLMNLLGALGTRVSLTTSRKRIRDEVYWETGAENPWRRNALWLVLRVGILRYLTSTVGNALGRIHYKFIIAVFMAQVLAETFTVLQPDITIFQVAKLSRRVFKIHRESYEVVSEYQEIYNVLFTVCRPLFQRTIVNANRHILQQWSSFKASICRPVPLLSRRADAKHLYLALANSRAYVRGVCNTFSQMIKTSAPLVGHQTQTDTATSLTGTFSTYARSAFRVFDAEETLGVKLENTRSSSTSPTDKIIGLAKELQSYVNATIHSFHGNGEQRSLILLKVLQIWIVMDEAAVKSFPLLADYPPPFTASISEVLQIASRSDLEALYRVQLYLEVRDRRAEYSNLTIFARPSQNCFAQEYYDTVDDGGEMGRLHGKIVAASEASREERVEEFERLSAEFEHLQKRIAESTCLFKVEDFGRVHDDTCPKCFLQRKARRMHIQVFENLLPDDPVQAKVVVFELCCPPSLAAYRDATWALIRLLTQSTPLPTSQPTKSLKECTSLHIFGSATSGNVTLASTTKSFLSTHYRSIRLPTTVDRVCLPNGLKFEYYDSSSQTWPGRIDKQPDFSHQCHRILPANSPLSLLQFSEQFAVDHPGPTSYEILASQTKVPSGVNVHEYTAFQTIYSGLHRRWPQMLLELCSINLNLSTEATCSILSQLALQAGPACAPSDRRSLRRIFRDQSFCVALHNELDQRLDAIRSSWREAICMETLITLSLQLYHQSDNDVGQHHIRLLLKAKSITFDWVNRLRAITHTATTAAEAKTYSRYSFWAAILCRRYFCTHNSGAAMTIDLVAADDPYRASSTGVQVFPAAELEQFIICSITIQDNLPTEPSKLPTILKNALARDLRMVYGLRHLLRHSLQACPAAFKLALDIIWPHNPAIARSLDVLEISENFWCQSKTLATSWVRQQSVQYSLLEGHLLIDGKPLGKLPAKVLESRILKELFGNQNLLTYPSALPGMIYQLAFTIQNHEIHLGWRQEHLIIQALYRETILELIPPEIFAGQSGDDLPATLIQGCVHWLDLHAGTVEARRHPEIWKSQSGNWSINYPRSVAWRRKITLVDPHCAVSYKIAKIFEHFEDRSNIVITQPPDSSIKVEIRRLDLSFFVNKQNLLECRELQSVIDPNQDAGTWYGLNSKLVLRDVINPRQRSMIVPMGTLSCGRNRLHQTVFAANAGTYGRYFINETLGRLDCPPEPALIYLKALFHAHTSFPIPDPLTGQTGVEEALSILTSGLSKPWSPLNPKPQAILNAIGDLTPKRLYYPKDLKVLQQVLWKPHLSTEIQHEAFRSVVDNILLLSSQITTFSDFQSDAAPKASDSELTLSTRHLAKHQLYKRPSDAVPCPPMEDVNYFNKQQYSQRQADKARNVYDCVTLLYSQGSFCIQSSRLANILHQWPVIGGYDRAFDKILLSDRLDCDIALEWGPLVQLCRSSKHLELPKLAFLFAAMAFRLDVDMDAIRILIAFAHLKTLRQLPLPQWPSFIRFRHNFTPTVDHFTGLIDHCRVPYPGDERQVLGRRIDYSLRRKLEAAQITHEQETSADAKAFATHLLKLWPSLEPCLEGIDRPLLIDVPQAFGIVQEEWLRLVKNLDLSRHVEEAQNILSNHVQDYLIDTPPQLASCDKSQLPGPRKGLPTLKDRLEIPLIMNGTLHSLQNAAPMPTLQIDRPSVKENLQIQKENIPFTDDQKSSTKALPPPSDSLRPVQEIVMLREMLSRFVESKSSVRKRYGQDLLGSVDALESLSAVSTHALDNQWSLRAFSEEIQQGKYFVEDSLRAITSACSEGGLQDLWLTNGGLWPAATPTTVLQHIRSLSSTILPRNMRSLLFKYGLAIVHLQKALRCEDALLRGKSQLLQDEQGNTGHENWQPHQHPDWLLLEIDSNILIRKGQVDVALATMNPATNSNSVLQMNMGEGKTSVVMPMAACILANSKNLLRIIVPKALLPQTAQIMQARLGGLLGRDVRHIPFSRKTSTSSTTIQSYRQLHEDIQIRSGIMLVLPEHLLSFKLSGLQRLSEKRIPEAKQMLSVQHWLETISRDVLDESDFTLAVKTQLIYPSGEQITVDGHPKRWEVAEALLQLVQGHLWDLLREFPRSMEIVERPANGFPLIFLLRKDVEDAMLSRLVEDILRERFPLLPIEQCSKQERVAIKTFLASPTIRQNLYEHIRQSFAEQPATRKVLFLLRGYLVHRILLLTLKKRWNVQYGLHPYRDPIAVPYHAKGVPSEQSEFGHPDVAITFTCLAFYYSGLTIDQLKQSLENISRSDDPSDEYEQWTAGVKSLPGSLRQWSVINVGDTAQIEEIWHYVRFQITIIDYFLNHFVFPQHAKQFQTKLQTSGWDIPLRSAEDDGNSVSKSHSAVSSPAPHLTTGFSGTNDNRTMLPLTVAQHDLPGLLHTNAEVLTYLFQPRNRFCHVMADPSGKRQTELDLLKSCFEMHIRMLIDAGAQILELDNKALVKAWLKIDYEAHAAVYFDENNKPWVLYRNMDQVPLLASPFADNLENCLVYLDEAHTRGTDLKMPANARGALTLGLGQTKDHTVQAAMRLRKLGTTQSIVFFVPPEVKHSILDFHRRGPGDHFDSSDVVHWLLEQTCAGLEQLQPLYFSQGVNYCRRTQAALDNAEYLTAERDREKYIKVIRQSEKQTLEQLYQPVTKQKAKHSTPPHLAPAISAYMKELNRIRKSFQDCGNAVQASALQEVEQEREVAYEVQAVRESQKPVHYDPLVFPGLSQNISRFLVTGRLLSTSEDCEHFLSYIGRTTLGLKHGINGYAHTSKLYVSKEFARTVAVASSTPNTDYMRQPTWLLWSTNHETALLINPEEAEIIIPQVLNVDHLPTHLLLYAAPTTRKMTHFNKLQTYAAPALPEAWKSPIWLSVELLLFSGGLYFDYDLYNPFMEYLGLATAHTTHDEQHDDTVDESGAEDSNVGASVPQPQPRSTAFTAKPLAFLQEWLAIRRKGQDFAHTPMGYVCQGKKLDPNHPFFAQPGTSTAAKDGTAQQIPPDSKSNRYADKQRPGATDESDVDDEDDRDFGEEELGGEDLLEGDDIGWEDEEEESYSDREDESASS